MLESSSNFVNQAWSLVLFSLRYTHEDLRFSIAPIFTHCLLQSSIIVRVKFHCVDWEAVWILCKLTKTHNVAVVCPLSQGRNKAKPRSADTEI